MAILVTGGTGLIGFNIARILAEQDRDPVIFDRRPVPPKLVALADMMAGVKTEVGNVADLSQVLHVIKKHRIDGIIHCAAIVGTDANSYPLEALQVNIFGAANMLEAARIMGLGRVVITSSSSVMGAPDDLVAPRKEEEIILPLAAIYPVSKLTCEQLVYTYRQLYKVDAISIRPRNCYGSPSWRDRDRPIWRVVNDVVEGKPVRKETGLDSVFDLTYVNDCAQGMIQAYDCKSPSYYVYNISYGKNARMSEVCDALKKLFPKVHIEVGPGLWEGILAKGKQADLTYRGSQRPPQDITRAKQDFGFNPQWPVSRAIPDWVKMLTKEKF